MVNSLIIISIGALIIKLDLPLLKNKSGKKEKFLYWILFFLGLGLCFFIAFSIPIPLADFLSKLFKPISNLLMDEKL
ncbi:hypothetical protein H9650_10240 [Psychrobacillus sp. Sa2BUA9]|uniref:Uncharacterized protein n=1 Tax=Psychrobacillus faecigallinarum TaxID=2762235 RepID=A0ABR8R9Z6_9BACI|nr:hypothetical protein [Psychrobacillus faecigallinarum]MBD7944495.1 hypothetical protein [Psychrobacillus faecigallinarum]QGM30108.1 hypothetical protein GI482_06840 [Bacillus sp. N3536]